ncbi:hypothetical protein [Fusobacterium sp.]|uniref:hypothetical protein n=1 Tax=Fusobacterium sp. TaxID=68766 RepID=UPI00290339B4|nr:hypothetical protein [Fusobacterium sp.]MDU1909612.1 hypothetical protein [Fusobacterium sp.]
MEFITKRTKRILAAFEVTLGLIIFITFVSFAIITSKMGNIHIPHEEIISIVGEEPTLADFGGGEKLIQAKEEYSKKYKIEKNKKLEVLQAERKKILNQKLIKLGIAETIIAIIIFFLYLRTIVKSFKIEDNTITFTYVNNKQKQINIVENNVKFQRVRLFSIRYMYIPRIYYIFHYTYKAQKEDQETVYISEKEGIKIAEYFDGIK